MEMDKEIEILQGKYDSYDPERDPPFTEFSDFPLSKNTQRGLADGKYKQPTDVQRKTIMHCLLGKDVSATAVTGSGKTLAFVIPVLEALYVKKWSRTDGIGAIIITPTRELSYQIFEVLKTIGKYHDFSAGLIIGGKNLKFERKRMDKCNILVCTPGRLLQHMDSNPLFDSSTLQILVLDEADRCLDMGFEETLNAIIENLPPSRQTLLFSATQTDIKDLACLNLQDPIYIGCEKDGSTVEVPELLQQNYVVVALADKLTMLWSFIKNHLKQKIIVFFATCKQVKYVHEVFSKLRPGTSVLALYGTLHQDRRIAVYNEFMRKSNVVLFATDIASRGLDFPLVNWVVQLDCPEDMAQYVHRAGRSARNKARGESLLVLMPSEENGMIEELSKYYINLKRIHIDPKKMFSPCAKIQGFVAQNPELKASAQRAFIAYLKSVIVMKNKNIFKISELNLESFALSLGLVVTPQVAFLDRYKLKHEKKPSTIAQALTKTRTFGDETKEAPSSDTEEELISLKRANHDVQEEQAIIYPKNNKAPSKAAVARRALKKGLKLNTKRTFDETEEPQPDDNDRNQEEKDLMSDEESGLNIEKSLRIIKNEDKYDKHRFRELVKIRHKNEKNKRKQAKQLSDAESETSGDVDLSWLPDPNQIYENGNRQGKNTSHKSKDIAVKTHKPKELKKIKLTDNLSLTEAEAIASQLLSAK